jgi:hypothetical protein
VAITAGTDNTLSVQNSGLVDENQLFERVASIIENRKWNAAAYANREETLMYRKVGRFIGSTVLNGERGAYGKKILVTLSQQLQLKYGNSFKYTKITKIVKFAELVAFH